MFAPCGGILGDQAPETSFHLLIKAFSLASRLRVVPQGQASHSSGEPAEFPPEPRHKLGPPIRYGVLGKPVDSENLVHRDRCRFLGRGKFGQGYESSHLREPVHHSKDCGVALRYRKPCDEVY